MPITISDISKDMANLAAAFGALAAAPQPPFTSADQAHLASCAGSAVQATTHLAIVGASGGVKTSTARALEQCHADATAVTAKLDAVSKPPSTVRDTAPQLFEQAKNATNAAYAIA
ncbi:hypothetical protein H3H36_15810 [Duganella sp. FT3S]|uniref:Uncharacterized protein n=1 Tax=Rugamonas fusca TaxID=2758568 RepID=A0A7W2EJ30_9BURK|nr:hypothetical protein [Rugamonas fusca]MBA5606821.1 hypothetical protein [Rugamonas fusca]